MPRWSAAGTLAGWLVAMDLGHISQAGGLGLGGSIVA